MKNSVSAIMTPTGRNQLSSSLASTAESAGELVEQENLEKPDKPQDSNQMSITLVFSIITRQVLCVEAGKDFVDLLLSFLTLPIGCIVKLLSDASLLRSQESISAALSTTSPLTAARDPHGKALSSISNVFDSVVKMEDSLLRIDKGLLLEARPQIPPICIKLLPVTPLEGEKKEVNYYCCYGVSCNFVSRRYGIKCPRHKRKMYTLCKVIDSERSDWELQGHSKVGPGCYLKGGALQAKVSGGYVKAGSYFVVTNNLEIYPSSAIKGLAHLKILQSERISDLDNLDIQVGSEEVLQLLKASVCFGNVLSRVFGKHIKKPVTSPLPHNMAFLPTPKQIGRSYPSIATSGKRAAAGRKVTLHDGVRQ